MIESLVGQLNSLVWGPAMLVLILGTGLFLMIGTGGFPLRQIPRGFKLLWKGRNVEEEGDISSWGALMTALAATIGTGNIAGVATAIFLGGPGALFWMWMTALIGLATKYAEAVLAVHFRETDEAGDHVGGPMYYIKNGLSKNWRFLAFLFALFAMIAGFGIGNMVQSNSVAKLFETHFSINPWITGGVLSVSVGLVLIGGVRRIADVAGALVPVMAITYIAGAASVLFLYAHEIPGAFALVFEEAFTPTAAQGGFAGATLWAAIRFGVARGVFSNEAGLGSAPIAHAAASTNDPVRQGMVAMLGTFIDTLVVCSLTGLVILVTGAWKSGVTGAALNSQAFGEALGDKGEMIVTGGLAIFAFSTLIGWSYYGEKSAEYIFGLKAVPYYRVLWVVCIPLGAAMKLEFVWLIADTLNALMAIPNLIALVLLSPVVFGLTKTWKKGHGL